MVKHHLALAIMFGLGISGANAGDFTFSPTIDSGISATRVKSENDVLKRQDIVTLNELDMDVDYDASVFKSKLNLNAFDIRYSDFSEGDGSFFTYDWVNTLSLLNDNWISEAYYESDYEILNTVRGTFNDFMYEAGEVHDIERYGARTSYDLPEVSRVQGNVNASFTGNKVTSNQNKSLNRQRQFKVDFGLGQTSSRDPLQWSLSGYGGRTENRFDKVYEFRGGNALIRIPLTDLFKVVALGDYSHHVNPATDSFGEQEDAIEYATYGLGLAYYDRDRDNLVQLSVSRDKEAEKFFPGADFRWNLGYDHYVKGSFTRRFYGDSGSFKYYYGSERNRIELHYDEELDLRYTLEPTLINEGLFVCQDGIEAFDDSLCWQPDELNYELQPGESLYPKFRMDYPLVERLALSRSLGFNWFYNGDIFTTKFQLFKNLMEEIGSHYEQDSDNVDLFLSHRLNSTNSLDYEFKYRKMVLNPIGTTTHDNLYKVTYKHELNSRAQWSFAVQHVRKDSDDRSVNFDETRVTLSYEHHFGKRNKRVRELF
jgi:hypothetical protein|tara:strand:- start:1079 stop:2698 length:1620 start_codon:yes stop_codon:yes gene_type:complete